MTQLLALANMSCLVDTHIWPTEGALLLGNLSNESGNGISISNSSLVSSMDRLSTLVGNSWP